MSVSRSMHMYTYMYNLYDMYVHVYAYVRMYVYMYVFVGYVMYVWYVCMSVCLSVVLMQE